MPAPRSLFSKRESCGRAEAKGIIFKCNSPAAGAKVIQSRDTDDDQCRARAPGLLPTFAVRQVNRRECIPISFSGGLSLKCSAFGRSTSFRFARQHLKARRASEPVTRRAIRAVSSTDRQTADRHFRRHRTRFACAPVLRWRRNGRRTSTWLHACDDMAQTRQRPHRPFMPLVFGLDLLLLLLSFRLVWTKRLQSGAGVSAGVPQVYDQADRPKVPLRAERKARQARQAGRADDPGTEPEPVSRARLPPAQPEHAVTHEIRRIAPDLSTGHSRLDVPVLQTGKSNRRHQSGPAELAQTVTEIFGHHRSSCRIQFANTPTHAGISKAPRGIPDPFAISGMRPGQAWPRHRLVQCVPLKGPGHVQPHGSCREHTPGNARQAARHA